jgi:hypothetical protein
MTYNKVEELCRYCGGTRETCTAERAGRQGDFAKGLDPDEEHAGLEARVEELEAERDALLATIKRIARGEDA